MEGSITFVEMIVRCSIVIVKQNGRDVSTHWVNGALEVKRVRE